MKTLQIARVWMMMVDAVVLDLSFKACKYGGALLGFFITRTYVYLCLLRVQSSRSILLLREVRFRTEDDKVHWATFTTFTWISLVAINNTFYTHGHVPAMLCVSEYF